MLNYPYNFPSKENTLERFQRLAEFPEQAAGLERVLAVAKNMIGRLGEHKGKELGLSRMVWLNIQGERGRGKTYLAEALVNEIIKAGFSDAIRYMNSDKCKDRGCLMDFWAEESSLNREMYVSELARKFGVESPLRQIKYPDPADYWKNGTSGAQGLNAEEEEVLQKACKRLSTPVIQPSIYVYNQLYQSNLLPSQERPGASIYSSCYTEESFWQELIKTSVDRCILVITTSHWPQEVMLKSLSGQDGLRRGNPKIFNFVDAVQREEIALQGPDFRVVMNTRAEKETLF